MVLRISSSWSSVPQILSYKPFHDAWCMLATYKQRRLLDLQNWGSTIRKITLHFISSPPRCRIYASLFSPLESSKNMHFRVCKWMPSEGQNTTIWIIISPILSVKPYHIEQYARHFYGICLHAKLSVTKNAWLHLLMKVCSSTFILSEANLTDILRAMPRVSRQPPSSVLCRVIWPLFVMDGTPYFWSRSCERQIVSAITNPPKALSIAGWNFLSYAIKFSGSMTCPASTQHNLA